MTLTPQFSHGALTVKYATSTPQRVCALPGCEADLPTIPGRENQNLYCCRNHREVGRRLRRERRFSATNSPAAE